MEFLLLFFLLCGIEAIDIDLMYTLLMGDPRDIYKLKNAREAVQNSLEIFDKIRLTSFQKEIIWDVYKNKKLPEQLTASDLANATELLPTVPENDLFYFNVSNWRIIRILARVKNFSRRQVAVIASAIKNRWSIRVMREARYLNKLLGLICGFSEAALEKISETEFKQISSAVFSNLYACTDQQLRAMYRQVRHTFGTPQCWTKESLRHLGMIPLVLNKNEVRSIRLEALKGINIAIISKMRPHLLNLFSEDQLAALNISSKLVVHQNVSLLIPNSAELVITDVMSYLTTFFLKTYLLLRC